MKATSLLERSKTKDYLAIATALAEELSITAQERDRQAGLPDLEVQRLRETGLLTLIVPKVYGGVGENWITALQVVRKLSQADGSIGQLYGNHLTLVTAIELIGTTIQAESYYQLTAQKQMFWGNAGNPRDTRLTIVPEADSYPNGQPKRYRVNGMKSFSTGAAISDLRVMSAVQIPDQPPVFFVIPRERQGVRYNHDWDNMGQRRTASGSLTLENVLVYADEILGPPPESRGTVASFLSVVAQLTKVCVYLGIAEGAVVAATNYTNSQSRSWKTTDRASQDPYILRHYGELWAKLQAAISLVDRTTYQVQAAWDKGEELTPEARGECAIAVAATKVFVVQVGLEITTRLFDAMGARSTATAHGFDRYWRDLRTFSLHDPIDYKLYDIGNWLLNQEYPAVTSYS